MTLRVRVHPEAAAELRQARDYYRDIDPDLAVRLLAEHDMALRYIRGFPHAGPSLYETYRHVVLPHFPYMIIYETAEGTLRVLAVVHTRRDPAQIQRELASRIGQVPGRGATDSPV